MSDFPPAPPPPPHPTGATPPPGYVAYGTPAAAQGWTKPIRGLGKALLVLQSLALVGTIVALVVNFSLIDKAEDFLDGRTTESAFEDDLVPYVSVGALSGALGLAVLILLIVWSFRIAKNLQTRLGPITWKPGLTIVVWLLGGCTLNIINFLMLREHWEKSEPGASTYESRTASRSNPLIIVWFVLTLGQVAAGIASGIRSLQGFRFGSNNEDVAETLSDQLAWTIAAGIFGIAAAALLIVIVRQLTERHAQFIGDA